MRLKGTGDGGPHVCPRQEDITILVIRGIIGALFAAILAVFALVWRMTEVYDSSEDIPAAIAGLAGSLATSIGGLIGSLGTMLTSVGRSGSSADPVSVRVDNQPTDPVPTNPQNAPELPGEVSKPLQTTNHPSDPVEPLSGETEPVQAASTVEARSSEDTEDLEYV